MKFQLASLQLAVSGLSANQILEHPASHLAFVNFDICGSSEYKKGLDIFLKL